MYRTLPSLIKGDIGNAFSSETGIYPSKESRKTQSKFKKMLPDPLDNALNALDAHQKKAFAKKDIEYVEQADPNNMMRKDSQLIGDSFLRGQTNKNSFLKK